MDSVLTLPGGAEATLIGILILALLVVVPLKLLISCVVFHKTGYSWALGLLMIVPIANLLMILLLAFGDWPVRRELRQFKQVRV